MSTNSLTAQIKDAERQVLHHKEDVRVSADRLVKMIRHQMTSPSTLLMAGGMGFMLGETTRHQNPDKTGSTGKPRQAETSPIMTAINLMISIHTLHAALPWAWLMETFNKPQTSAPITEKIGNGGYRRYVRYCRGID